MSEEIEQLVSSLLSGQLLPEDLLLEEEPGGAIDRFRLLGELGRGGMGTVYRAYDEDLGREVALKLPGAQGWSTQRLERFRREARALARLEHPGIVRLFETSAGESRPYLVLELVEGEDLDEALAQGLEREAALGAMAEVADALAYVHGEGLVHRDVKPGNVLITPQGRARLVDFGLAYDPDTTRVTVDGGLVGTAAYMAPEQIEGSPSPAADVYSLGASLYEVVSGHPPFRESEVLSLLKEVATRDPAPLAEVAPDTPPWLAALVHDCLTRDPRARPSAAEVAERLRHRTPPPPRSAAPTILATTLALLVLVAAAWLASGVLAEEPQPPARPAPQLEVLSWAYARPEHRGIELVRKVEATMRNQRFLSLNRRGESLLDFQLATAHPSEWTELVIEGRTQRVQGEQASSVTVSLDDVVIHQGKVHKTLRLPLHPLPAGPHRLRIQLDESARSTTLIGSVHLAYGSLPRPRAEVLTTWQASPSPPAADGPAELRLESASGVARTPSGALHLREGRERLEFSFAARYRPRWVVVQALSEKVPHAAGELDLWINDHRVLREWRGKALLLEGGWLKAGSNTLSIRHRRTGALGRSEFKLSHLSVLYGEGVLLPGERERIVHAPGEAD